MKNSKPKRTSAPSSKHRVDQYADDVLSGAIVAGPLVRLACERHQRDRATDGPYEFNAERADHIIDFFETVLRLPDMVDDNGDALPFILQPWQAFIVGSLFGWVDKTPEKNRRFREAYVEIGKGNGKTPLCAGIGLYGLVMDGERAAEIYAAAADQDQASILFRDAVRMAQASPDLWAILKPSGGDHIWQLEHKPSLSFFKTFSRESGARSGTRPHIGLLDELHEHGSHQISIKVRAGAKRRKQPMFIEITNSGFDRTTICWEHHEHSRKIMEQTTDDAQWFAYVCALDEGDDPLTNQDCHVKVNPNIGVSITRDYLDRQVSNARNIQAETNTVLRLNFCVWTQAHTRAIDMAKWGRCKPFPTASELLGATCYGAIDLGQSDDFTAWVRGWILSDGRVAVKCRFWIPQIAVDRYPDRPYDQWRRAGFLTVTPGNTTDYDRVEREILEDCRKDGVRTVSYDKRFAEQMAQHLIGAGVDLVDQPQGEWLHEGIVRKLELIENGLLCHGNDEILAWMASNYVTVKKYDRYRPDKQKAGDKIDGQVALDMLLMLWVNEERKPTPQYQFLVVGGKR